MTWQRVMELGVSTVLPRGTEYNEVVQCVECLRAGIEGNVCLLRQVRFSEHIAHYVNEGIRIDEHESPLTSRLMYLIQFLLPLYNKQHRFPKQLHDQVGEELTEKFHGLATCTRARVAGLWREDSSIVVRDDIVIYEVMAPDLDRGMAALPGGLRGALRAGEHHPSHPF